VLKRAKKGDEGEKQTYMTKGTGGLLRSPGDRTEGRGLFGVHVKGEPIGVGGVKGNG